jgi:predicted TIM-barrel enzyme
VIVGSSVKVDGRWENPVDPARAAAFVAAARAGRAAAAPGMDAVRAVLGD